MRFSVNLCGLGGSALKCDPTNDMTAEILRTHTPALFAAAVKRAADLLRAGELVALPTETVYGLAANALDPQAVATIFEAKGRPAHNPIIVHVASVEMAKRCVTTWPEVAEKLAQSFWPGPLTMVLPHAMEIPDLVHSGSNPPMWLSAGRAEREFVQPDFPDQRRARPQTTGCETPAHRGRRPIASGHRVHGD